MKLILNRFNVMSHSSNRTYVVAKYDDGTWACSCPSWIFKKGQKCNCKHIQEIQNAEYKPMVDTTISITGITDDVFKRQEVMNK